jgi:LmbE family N-acetylglucosaminyl deacetylase
MLRLIVLAGSAGARTVPAQSPLAAGSLWRSGAVVAEPRRTGSPRAGKVLAAIQPHADDIPLFAAGTVAKLVDEGCTGYLIRTTNDEKAGPGSMGETVLGNERDNHAVARALGLKKVFDLNYRNHRLDDASRQDLRGRLIFLFRALKVDIVVSYDPWGMYEENPDHYVTAQAVEAACWMAGGRKDYPEHAEAGVQPHSVTEKYYFARGPQLVNRVVDITSTIDRKIEANLMNVSQGPAGLTGSRMRAALAAKKQRLAVLGAGDETANREYIRRIVLDADSDALRGVPSDREVGKPYGFEWAEPFHYIGPRASKLEKYVSEHAEPIR